VVVIDNASIHHDHRVEEAIHNVGALVKYLPAYSPDLMPSEFVFSKIKAKLRNFGPQSTLVRACWWCAGVPSLPLACVHLTPTRQEPEVLINNACETVTQKDCLSYFTKCGSLYGDCYGVV